MKELKNERSNEWRNEWTNIGTADLRSRKKWRLQQNSSALAESIWRSWWANFLPVPRNGCVFVSLLLFPSLYLILCHLFFFFLFSLFLSFFIIFFHDDSGFAFSPFRIRWSHLLVYSGVRQILVISFVTFVPIFSRDSIGYYVGYHFAFSSLSAS